MKYLFVIQGEGRGHMTQAITLATMLRRHGHQVCRVAVGECSNRKLPQFFVDKIGAEIIRYNSPALNYGKQGRSGNMWLSILNNSRPSMGVKWIKSIGIIAKCIEESKPDVVINFYELLMGVTSLVHRVKPPIVSIAHQFMLEHSDYEHVPKSMQSQMMMSSMNRFCASGSAKVLALSLYPLPTKSNKRNSLVVVPPLLRSEIFELEPTKGDFILGYMLNPAFLDDILEWKKEHPEQKIHLFWDKAGAPEVEERVEGLWLHLINDKLFIELMAASAGYITTAGFESVCEAMYLGKAVMMIPAHIEQEINASDAVSAGAGISSTAFDVARLAEYIPKHKADNSVFREWVASAEEIILRELTNL